MKSYDPVGNLTNFDYPSSPDVAFAYDARSETYLPPKLKRRIIYEPNRIMSSDSALAWFSPTIGTGWGNKNDREH